MATQRWDPFHDFDVLPRRMARLMRLPELDWPTTEWSPSADCSEKTDEYVIRADLPEVRIAAERKDGVLTVRIPRRGGQTPARSED